MPQVKILKVINGNSYDDYTDVVKKNDDWETISHEKYQQLHNLIWQHGKSKRQTYVLIIREHINDELMTVDGFIKYGKKQEELEEKREVVRKDKAQKAAVTKKQKQDEKELLDFERLSKKFRAQPLGENQ